ncbi:MAG: tRNA pseudouridine(13) synthase TruD [Planctomycetes bacterium]|nr:tRNA pseudouridine(13) synthase TruD [Planctomycetota bacterium]
MEQSNTLMPGDSSDKPLRPKLPFLTADIGGVGGQIKTIPADFVVEEIPLYEFAGTGTHVYAYIQKKGLTTAELIARLGQSLNVRKFDIGYAGRKDSNAITRQWVSIEHIDPEKIENLDLSGIKVLDVTRHGNKLKVGHLKGNRFIIRLRNLNCPVDQARTTAQQVMDVLCRRGVPNYFGPQRFGYRYDSHLLGGAIIKNDIKEFFEILLGRPELDPQEEFIEARRLYQQGDFEAAFYAWHPALRDHRKALRVLMKNGGKLNKKTLRAMDARLLSLFVSAWQSDLFNAVLVKRLGQIETLLEGDMAYKHENGACFRVEDVEAEQPRCEAFDISPTGPLFGKRMTKLIGPAGDIENSILDPVELTDEDYTRLKRYGGTGGRRPLRFEPKNTDITTGTDDHGDFLQLRFELPSGCYATVLLREITKQDQ